MYFTRVRIDERLPRRSAPALHLALLIAPFVWLTGACKPPEPELPVSGCASGGELVADVYGSLEGRLDWRGEDLECDGMPRPRGRGARLRFAGPAGTGDGAARLAFIIALPDLERGKTAKELPAGVTLMQEHAGRFFSTPEQTACWADIEQQDPLGNAVDDDEPNEYFIRGLLYCVAPLAELNGNASVTLRDLRFSGRLSWAEPE